MPTNCQILSHECRPQEKQQHSFIERNRCSLEKFNSLVELIDKFGPATWPDLP
jgi:hypothetical protein